MVFIFTRKNYNETQTLIIHKDVKNYNEACFIFILTNL